MPTWSWRRFGAPAWSPDGTQIAFHRVLDYGDGRFNIEIFLMRADGRNVRQLTNRFMTIKIRPGRRMVARSPSPARSKTPVSLR